ncbi:MAG: hypothetical protein U0V18_02240 [Anaerolineales bacterium]
MQAAIIFFGILILLVLIWLLFTELRREKPEDQNEPVSENSQVVFSKWLENFKAWSGERYPISIERVGFTVLWSIFFLSLLDHLHTRSGLTGTLIYFLVILPHEAGHFICSPFGWFLSIAGGSIWQVLLFVIFGFIVLFRKRRNEALGWWAVAGHSLISLSTYIADASARSLTLIPIPDPSRHDWGNMLEYLGLLQYDWLFAKISIITGGAIVLSCVVAGLFFTWYQPQNLFNKPETETDTAK